MREASEEVVCLYRYVYKHGPVTFDEIVEKALPPAMRSHAYRAWMDHQAKEHEKQDLPAPVYPDEYWAIDANKEIAWRWWVETVVRTVSNTKRVSVADSEGKKVAGPRQPGWLYSVGPYAPMVKGPKGTLQRWGPELDQILEQLAAGQRVIQRADQAIQIAVEDIADRKRRDLVVQLIKDSLTSIRRK